MGDFNAKVGKDWEPWNGTLGRFGIGEQNERGEKLLSFCTVNNLCISNTLFKESKPSRQWTWESPDGVTKNKIDYIIIKRKWKSSVASSRSFPSGDIGSDHQLVLANIKLKLRSRSKRIQLKKYDVKKLTTPETYNDYQVIIGGKFRPLLDLPDSDLSTEEMWQGVKSGFNSTAEKVLGKKKTQKQKPWITAEIIHLTEERSRVKQERLKDSSKKRRYNFLNREIRRKCKERKDHWLQDLCKEIEEANSAKKSKLIYSTIKTITGKKATRMRSVKDKSGEVLTDDAKIKDRWKENYQELYNQPNPPDPSFLQTLPSTQTDEPEPHILKSEVEAAIKRLKSNKAPGEDGISAEEIKAAGEVGSEVILKLCNKIWESEVIPEDWGKAVIVPIFKKKDMMDCANYRGISLLSLAGKVFCSIIQSRIQKKTEEILSESQAGFRMGRSTVDQLFSLRQIAEKHMEIGRPLYCCYIDYQKAFDTVWQDGLWKSMEHLGYPAKIIRLLKALYKTSKVL